MMDHCQLTDLSAQKTPEASSMAGNVPAREYPVFGISCVWGDSRKGPGLARAWSWRCLKCSKPDFSRTQENCKKLGEFSFAGVRIKIKEVVKNPCTSRCPEAPGFLPGCFSG